MPWFWSQQGRLKLQIAGLSHPGDQTVLRGEPAADRFSVFCYRNGDLVAVESVSSPADHMAARRLLSQRRSVSPAEAADPAFNIKSHSLLAPLSH